MGTTKDKSGGRHRFTVVAMVVFLVILVTTTIAPIAQAASTWWWAVPVNSVASVLQGATRYEENHAYLLYAGTWRASRSSMKSGGGAVYAFQSGSSLTISFEGTGLTWVATTGPVYGKAEVTLDGGEPVTVDLFSPATRWKRAVYSTGMVADGTHRLQIAWTGRKTALSRGSAIEVDALYVRGSLADAQSTPGGEITATTTASAQPTTITTARPVTTTAASPSTTSAQPTTTTAAPSSTTAAPPTATTTTATLPATSSTTPTTTAAAAFFPTTLPTTITTLWVTTSTTVAPATSRTTAPPTTAPPTTAPPTTAPPATAPPATAPPTTVPPSFNLQAAIDSAAPGTTINIPAGTHTGPFRIMGKTDLTLRGPADAVLTAKGQDVITVYNSAGIVFEGFTLVGDYTMRGQKGIGIDGLRGGAFRDLTVRDAGNCGIYSNGVFTDITVSGCTVTHCGDFGIAFQNGGDRVLVENSVFSGFASFMYAGHGVYAKTSSNVTVRSCEASGAKHLSGYGDGGFQIAECTNAQVIDCRSYGNDGYGFIVDGGVATFTRCVGQSNGATDFYECGCTTRSTYIDCVGTTSRYPD